MNNDDKRDSLGIRVPPPLIYLLPLAAGLLLDRRLHVPFLPCGVACNIGGGLWEAEWRSRAGSSGRCETLVR